MKSTPGTLLLLASAFAAPLSAQTKPPKPKVPASPLVTSGLAGQGVAVLPLTMVVGDPRLPGTSGPKARATLLVWADSLLGDALAERVPEVTWILPVELRRTATRAVGLLPSPDRMGQAIMRSPNLKDMPDPLRSYVRQLLAMSNGARWALIPASVTLSADAKSDSLSVELAAVLVDGRLGKVAWRTVAIGKGDTADAAFHAALLTMFPDP